MKPKTQKCPECGKQVRLVYPPSFRPLDAVRLANHKRDFCGKRIRCWMSWHNAESEAQHAR